MDIKRKRILRSHGFDGKIDWKDVPVSDKSTIINVKPKNGFSELRITSGSTGDPLYVFYSDRAVKAFLKRTVISLQESGLKKDDIVLNLFAYGNYVPGSMYEKACQIIGVSVLPLGAPNTYPKEKVIECIKKVKPTVWLSVPSYALGLLNILEQIDLSLKPKKIMVAGEALLDSYIDKFKEFGIEVVNHFGLTECPAIGISTTDDLQSIKVIDKGIFVESYEVDGKGHLLVTDLYNESTPIIRYDTKDSIEILSTTSNGSLKEFKLIGRDGELTKLQGILVSKVKIINSLLKITDNFHIDLEIKGGRDVVSLYIDNSLRGEEENIMKSLDFLHCKKEINFVENFAIPKTISNKVKYIDDLRK